MLTRRTTSPTLVSPRLVSSSFGSSRRSSLPPLLAFLVAPLSLLPSDPFVLPFLSSRLALSRTASPTSFHACDSQPPARSTHRAQIYAFDRKGISSSGRQARLRRFRKLDPMSVRVLPDAAEPITSRNAAAPRDIILPPPGGSGYWLSREEKEISGRAHTQPRSGWRPRRP